MGFGGSIRIRWVDVARALAILLLVANHVTQQMELYGWDIGVIRELNQRMVTFRQPLFFALSGMLAASGIAHLRFVDLLRRKILLLAWIFLLWSTIWWLAYFVLPHTVDRVAVPVPNPIAAFAHPATPLWFLYGLAIYICFAWLVRRFPWWAQIGIAVAISTIITTRALVTIDSYYWQSIGTYLMFFMLGVVARRQMIRLAENTKAWWLVVALVAFALGTQVVELFPFRGLTRLVVSVLGVCVGIMAAVLIARLDRLAAVMQRIGRRTMPIYVVHTLVIAGILAIIAATLGVGSAHPETAGAAAALDLGPAVGAALFFALWVAAVGVATGLYKATRWLPGVFDLPPFLERIREATPSTKP